MVGGELVPAADAGHRQGNASSLKTLGLRGFEVYQGLPHELSRRILDLDHVLMMF
jgi:hypothetical protein